MYPIRRDSKRFDTLQKYAAQKIPCCEDSKRNKKYDEYPYGHVGTCLNKASEILYRPNIISPLKQIIEERGPHNAEKGLQRERKLKIENQIYPQK